MLYSILQNHFGMWYVLHDDCIDRISNKLGSQY